jgi:hypothetical protein
VSPHPSSESQLTHPSVQPPEHLVIYNPDASDSDEGTPDTGNSTGCGRISFDLAKLNGAVLSLLEGQSHGQGECFWPLHDMAFSNETIKAEFVELEYAGSEIKPGVLNTLTLVNSYLSGDGSPL